MGASCVVSKNPNRDRLRGVEGVEGAEGVVLSPLLFVFYFTIEFSISPPQPPQRIGAINRKQWGQMGAST